MILSNTLKLYIMNYYYSMIRKSKGDIMKKINLLLVLLISIFTVGCAESKTEKIESLQDAYFSFSKKIDKNEKVSMDYIQSVLSEYDYEDGGSIKDETDDVESQLHIFKNGKEKLTISDAPNSSENLMELVYQVSDETNNILLSYASANNNQPTLYTNINIVSDVDLYEKISTMVDIEYSKILNQYNKIAENALLDKDITVDDISKIVDIEPTSEDSIDPNTSLEVTYYSFKDGSEVLGAYCIKGEDKVSRVFYGNSDIVLMKNIIDVELLKNSDNIQTSIVKRVDSIEKQEEIIKVLFP